MALGAVETEGMEHPLRRYLNENGIRHCEFARRLGVSPGHFSDVLSGRSYLGRKRQARAAMLTGGRVTIEQLALFETPRPPELERGAA